MLKKIMNLTDDELMIIAIGVAIFAYGFIIGYLVTM